MNVYLRSPAKAIGGAVLIVLASSLIAAALTPVLPAVIWQGLDNSIPRYDPKTGAFRVEWRPAWCQGESARIVSGRSTVLYYFERDYLDCSTDQPIISHNLWLGWRPGEAEQVRPAFVFEVGPFRMIAAGIIETWANRAWLFGRIDLGTAFDPYLQIHVSWHRALCGAGHSCNLLFTNGEFSYFSADL